MAASTLGRRPRVVPAPTARIDAAHPLAGGLLACVLPGTTLVDLATGVRGSSSGSNSQAVSPYGPAVQGVTSTTAANPLHWGDAPGNVAALTDATFTCVATIVTLGNDTTFFGRWSNTAGQRTWLMFNQAGTNSIRLAISTAGGSISIAAGPSIVTGGSYVFVARRVGSTVTVYANGVPGSPTATTAGAFDSPAAAAPLRMVDTHVAADSGTTLYILGAVHGRALSDAEIATVSADPFCFLRF